MTVVAIIQARVGSTRLPGKTLKQILGKPMLWHIIRRVQAAKSINKIVVATSEKHADKKIAEIAGKLGVETFAGSEEDVLDRFYRAAKKHKADIVVRITADDPFKDPVIIDKIVGVFLKERKIDYVSNTMKPTYPEGLDVEVFSFTALKKAWKEATFKFDREHVTSYIWCNPKKFKLLNVEYEGNDLSSLRWTVDTAEDLDFAKEVYKRLYDKNWMFLMGDILDLLNKYPGMSRINEKVERRASLKEAGLG